MIAEEKLIVGADIRPQSSPTRKPRYDVCVFDGVEEIILDTFENVSFHRLIEIVDQTQAKFLASDNVYELVKKPSQIPYLCMRLTPNTKLVQVTGSPIHGFNSLPSLMNKNGIEVKSKLQPLEAAEACARLVNKKVGYIIEPFENETKIIVSRTRSKGSGGWSQSRYGRLFDTSVNQVANEVESILKDNRLDYDKHAKKSKYGAKKVVFTVYSQMSNVSAIIKRKKGDLVRVNIVPVNKERVEFIPLSQEVASKLKLKRLIVGIDPGLTVGLSILDLRGRVLKTKSIRQASRGQVIREISKFGKPTLICCDVYPYPSYVEKIAANLNGVLHAPRGVMAVSEKNKISRQLAMEQGISVNNAHERDSLAAAYSGYKKYKSQFEKVDKEFFRDFGKSLRDEIKDMLARGKSLVDAEDTIRTKLEAEKNDSEAPIITLEEKPIDTKEIRRKNKVLENEIITLEELLESEKKKNTELYAENKELLREVEYLRSKLAEGKSEYVKRLYKEQTFLQKDNKINALKEKNKRLNEELSFYSERLDELKRIAWLRGNEGWVPLKVIKKFSQEEIEKTEKRHGLRPGDNVLILDTTGGGGQTAELLIDYNVKSIIGNVNHLSYYAKKKLMEHHIPLIDSSDVEIIRMDEIAIIKEEDLNSSIEQATREIDQVILTEKESFLENLVDQYRKERKKDFKKFEERKNREDK